MAIYIINDLYIHVNYLVEYRHNSVVKVSGSWTRSRFKSALLIFTELNFSKYVLYPNVNIFCLFGIYTSYPSWYLSLSRNCQLFWGTILRYSLLAVSHRKKKNPYRFTQTKYSVYINRTDATQHTSRQNSVIKFSMEFILIRWPIKIMQR